MADKVLLNFCAKFNKQPSKTTANDIETLRTYGFTEQQILEAVVIVGFAQFANTVANNVGWPRKSSDRSASLVPFISDQCYSGYGTPATTSLSDINITGGSNKKYSGHVNNGTLQSVNLGFADGHVEANKRAKIQAQYIGDSGQACWFY